MVSIVLCSGHHSGTLAATHHPNPLTSLAAIVVTIAIFGPIILLGSRGNWLDRALAWLTRALPYFICVMYLILCLVAGPRDRTVVAALGTCFAVAVVVTFRGEFGLKAASRTWARRGAYAFVFQGLILVAFLVSLFGLVTSLVIGLWGFPISGHGHAEHLSATDWDVYFIWQIAHAIPSIDLTYTFGWAAPVEVSSVVIGMIVLIFKIAVSLPVVAYAARWWRLRAPSTTERVVVTARSDSLNHQDRVLTAQINTRHILAHAALSSRLWEYLCRPGLHGESSSPPTLTLSSRATAASCVSGTSATASQCRLIDSRSDG
jgi:hypothetical protein